MIRLWGQDKKMGTGAERAFQAQLLLPQQRELFDYWQSRKQGGAAPSRDDISPADIPHLLPNVSLLELLPEPDLVRFRLAGTALWDVYGREMTGHTLSSAGNWGGSHSYWQRNYRLMAESRQPAAGMLRAPSAGREHLVHFWMRLPVRGRDDAPMLLGLDICMAASRLGDDASSEESISAGVM